MDLVYFKASCLSRETWISKAGSREMTFWYVKSNLSRGSSVTAVLSLQSWRIHSSWSGKGLIPGGSADTPLQPWTLGWNVARGPFESGWVIGIFLSLFYKKNVEVKMADKWFYMESTVLLEIRFRGIEVGEKSGMEYIWGGQNITLLLDRTHSCQAWDGKSREWKYTNLKLRVSFIFILKHYMVFKENWETTESCRRRKNLIFLSPKYTHC